MKDFLVCSFVSFFLSPSFLFSICLCLPLFPLRTPLPVSPSLIYHLQLSRWAKDERGRMRVKGKRRHWSTEDWLPHYRFISSQGGWKWKSFLPAGVWIKSLESYSITVNYLCSCVGVHKKQKHWLLLQIILASKSNHSRFSLIQQDMLQCQAT